MMRFRNRNGGRRHLDLRLGNNRHWVARRRNNARHALVDHGADHEDEQRNLTNVC